MLILVVLFIVLAVVVSLFGKLMNQRRQLRLVFASIEKKLMRQYDLLPDWVSMAEAHLPCENFETANEQIRQLEWQAKSRNKSVEEKVTANNELQDVLSNIGEVINDFTIVKTDERVHSLQQKWSKTESELFPAIKAYNEAVKEYNRAVSSFPYNIVAKILNYPLRSELDANKVIDKQ